MMVLGTTHVGKWLRNNSRFYVCYYVIKHNNVTIVQLVKRLLTFLRTQWITTVFTLSGCSAC